MSSTRSQSQLCTATQFHLNVQCSRFISVFAFVSHHICFKFALYVFALYKFVQICIFVYICVDLYKFAFSIFALYKLYKFALYIAVCGLWTSFLCMLTYMYSL